MDNRTYEALFVKPRDGQQVFSRSYNKLMEDAAEAEAIVRVGRSVLISVKKLETYYNSLAGR